MCSGRAAISGGNQRFFWKDALGNPKKAGDLGSRLNEQRRVQTERFFCEFATRLRDAILALITIFVEYYLLRRAPYPADPAQL
jgi:hypothetical protein